MLQDGSLEVVGGQGEKEVPGKQEEEHVPDANV